jgi:serine/threonine protein kinase
MNYQTKNYQVVSELGHGAQGSVYLVKDEDTHLEYAAKVVIKFLANICSVR